MEGKAGLFYSEYCNHLLPGIATQDSFWELIKFDDGSFASIGSSWVLEDSSGADVSARMEILGTRDLIELNCGIEEEARCEYLLKKDGIFRMCTTGQWLMVILLVLSANNLYIF